MDEIAKSHPSAPSAPGAGRTGTPSVALASWLEPVSGLLPRLAAALRSRGAHPARTVVLLPYAQLMPLARGLWAQAVPDGFAPHFETTRNWARRLAIASPAPMDYAQDAARDTLAARTLLERAGLGAQQDALAGAVVEVAASLSGLAAAVAPGERSDWAARLASVVGSAEGPLALEGAVARVALAWVGASACATDVLFEPQVADGLDCLVVLEGFQTDPLTQALVARFGDRALVFPLQPAAARLQAAAVALHTATGAEDEAERAAACVLRHIEAGRVPVALAANDRVLTRRVRALLSAQHIDVRDENGWKLSTTRAAAQLMAVLRACAWNAASDDVLDWLKHTPAAAAATVRAVEAWLRKRQAARWRAVVGATAAEAGPVAQAVAQVEAWRGVLQGARELARWTVDLRALLQVTGAWDALCTDDAGARVVAVLRLEAGAGAELEALPAAGRRLSLNEFTRWAGDVLEAAHFVPPHPVAEQVTVLPLAQLLGRPFAALVLPGCDEVRLPVSPEPPGPWTAAQRLALGLPSREALEAAHRAAWSYALALPAVDLLWRTGDDGGEPLLPSPLVQSLLLTGAGGPATDPRTAVGLEPAPQPRPQPSGATLPLSSLSASAYADLRACPYRFFALRQLGLAEVDEIETELSKRDFGNWLHAVLRQFHDGLKARPAEAAERRARLDGAAAEVTRTQALDDGEFLPFAAAWPRVRDGYLDWLTGHEAKGHRFDVAEAWQPRPLGDFELAGRIDRIDTAPDGQRLVIDYKTESDDVTRKRISAGAEDTQLVFYAALLEDDTVRAAYVNVGEKDGTKAHEQDAVVELRDALVHGVLDDLARIAGGVPLPALGDGVACDFCAARGLCRKDFW
jgi:ATP-dependent helicase/nuclease subunit B